MAEIRLQDLSPAARKRVLAHAKPSPHKPHKAPQGLPLTCSVCGYVESRPSEHRIRRHEVEQGHGSVRWEWRP